MVLLWLFACGGGSAPTIETFELGREFLGEGNQGKLTLVVSDEDGLDDVASATIFDESTGLAVLELGAPDAAGEYDTTLSWDDFVALEALDFEDTQARPLRAVVTDARGLESEPATAEITLRCRGFGGLAIDDKCFHIAPIGEAASRTCADVCGLAKFNFTCDTKLAVDVFGEVGSINFDVDDNGTVINQTVSIDDCNTAGSSVPFTVSTGQVTIPGASRVLWTCNCRP